MKRYAFIFPGQGSQNIGMGKDFYENFTLAKEAFKEASETLSLDFTKLLFEENEQINQTSFTQPSIFLVSYIAHEVLKNETNIEANLALGHSLGEVSAYSIGSELALGETIKLTHHRGKLMSEACEGKHAGMMAVIGLDDAILENFCKKAQEHGQQIYCANYNSENQMVLAGKKNDLTSSEQALKDLGAKKTMLLPMSVASHCPILESATNTFKELLQNVLKNDSAIKIISNADAQSYQSKGKALECLSNQLIKPVLYKQSIKSIENDVDIFIELGNGALLKGLNRRITQKPTLNISDVASLKATLQALN